MKTVSSLSLIKISGGENSMAAKYLETTKISIGLPDSSSRKKAGIDVHIYDINGVTVCISADESDRAFFLAAVIGEEKVFLELPPVNTNTQSLNFTLTAIGLFALGFYRTYSQTT